MAFRVADLSCIVNTLGSSLLCIICWQPVRLLTANVLTVLQTGFVMCVLVSVIFRLLPVTNLQQNLSVIWPTVSVYCGSFCDSVSTWNMTFLIFDPVWFSGGGLITQRAWRGNALGDQGNQGYCSLQRHWLLLHSVRVAFVTCTVSCAVSVGDKAGLVWSYIFIPEPVPSVSSTYAEGCLW